LSTEQANFNGDYPYAGAEKGEYRERTMAVLSFAPNAWGLWQMHGNVWEWCQDFWGDYPAESVVDPKGVAEGQQRVLRGGGWFLDGRLVRSAYRDASSPVLRIYGIGLRLAGGDPQAGRRMAADRWERSERALGGDVTIKRKGLKERVLHIFSRFGK